MELRQSLLVYDIAQIRVRSGADLRDFLGEDWGPLHEDRYEPAPSARMRRLSLLAGPESGAFRVDSGTGIGHPGHRIKAVARLNFMALDDGQAFDAVLLADVDTPENGPYLASFAEFAPRSEYALVEADRAGGLAALARFASASFAAGTHILLASGDMRPIEELKVDDRVITRDHGPQRIRWIGHQTVRAEGPLAPVTIRQGLLGNIRDLRVSPHHRLYIYQRQDELGLGRAEVSVQAGLLVNGSSVVQQPGGHLDYYQLLFDHHAIIYAEGIAAESRGIGVFDDGRDAPLRARKAVRAHLEMAGNPVQLRLGERPDQVSVEAIRRATGLDRAATVLR